MISSLMWIPKGVAKAVPDEYKPSEEEIEEMKRELQAEARRRQEKAGLRASQGGADGQRADGMEDDDEDGGGGEKTEDGGAGGAEAGDELAEFDMAGYDDEEEGVTLSGGGMAGLTYFENADTGDGYVAIDDTPDEEERDDTTIRPSDLLLLTAKTEDQVPSLEVHIYEEQHSNLYVHHDLLLPAFPLSLAWLDFWPTAQRGEVGARGNLFAVGTFDPAIEVWDLDVIDCPDPVLTLGGAATPPGGATSEGGSGTGGGGGAAGGSKDKGKGSGKGTNNKKKKKKGKNKSAAGAAPPGASGELRPGSHTDAVMSLSWNAKQRNLLASGSADKTVKIWDLSRGECADTRDHHNGREVQCVAWNATESSVLASAGFDRSACVFDVRSKDVSRWDISADAEAMSWNPHQPYQLVVSAEDGTVVAFDARKSGSGPIYTLQAHDGAPCNALSFSTGCPNLLATGSIDKSLKLWDVSNDRPTLVDAVRDGNLGTVFALSFCPESPFLLASGGGKGKSSVIDLAQRPAIAERFPVRGKV